jgi:prophage regulatory protein
MNEQLRLLRRPQVVDRTGLRPTLIDSLERRGEFPRRVKISERAAGWIEHEVNDWIAQRIAASRPRSQP